MDHTHDRLEKILSAFAFVIRNETYAVNFSALNLQKELDRGFECADHTIMWESVSSILTHSANLSKIFWPQLGQGLSPAARDEMRVRGVALRSVFETQDGSPLQDRAVRNRFEHLDEDIHRMAVPDDAVLVDQFIGTTAQLRELSDRYVWRSFDYETGIVTVGTKTVALTPPIAESDRIYYRWRELHQLRPTARD